MVWSSPERHGAMTGLMKTQVDWILLSEGAVRPTQGKTLAVIQVSGGSRSFNAVNQMRILVRWMRLITIPNQPPIPKAFQEFDEAGRMRPSPLYDRIVYVMEERMKFTLLTRDHAGCLLDRYSERKETARGAYEAGHSDGGSLRATQGVARCQQYFCRSVDTDHTAQNISAA